MQKRFTKQLLIAGCNKLKYSDRLKKLKLTSFESRCTRSDLILVYKILTGEYKCLNYLFKINSNQTRGNGRKSLKERTRLELRRHTFCNRVVNVWNKLPSNIVM